MHIADRLLAVNKAYISVETLKYKTSGNIYQFDSLMGQKGIPNARGSHDYYIGDSISGSIPIMLDEQAFRTVPDDLQIFSDTLDLFLGCSFTFGDLLPAEDCYPYKTSKLLNHSFINAGQTAYGLAQMKLLIDTLLPKYKFNYVFIQLSPWLADRAMVITGQTNYGFRPFPYFSDRGNGFVLNKPAFKSHFYSSKQWRKTTHSYVEKLSFALSDGWRFEILDYYSFVGSVIKIKLGIKPGPTKRKEELEKYFYNYAINRCKQYNAIPLILKLQYPNEECQDLLNYIRNKASVIDLDSDLERIINETGKDHKSLFEIYHVYVEDTIVFDQHPNKYAHELFSEKIFNELKNN